MADEPSLHGLSVVVEPEEATVDIVFVHGFTGHPVRTWAHKTATVVTNTAAESDIPEQRHVKIPRLSSKPFRKPTNGEKVYWPRHLLPRELPRARVLVYGYDTRIRHAFGGPVSQNTIYDIASDLLQELRTHRRLRPCRPLVFIAHSLGGIIVKEALRQAPGYNGYSDPNSRRIHESTISIMFFGTPHGGADPGGLRKIIGEKAARAAGFSANEQVVSALLPTSERLQELRDTFSPMARQNAWLIFSFQEQYGLQLLSGHKVVDDVSSRLGDPSIEKTRHIANNHMDMCRFSGFDDVEYLKVAAALQELQDRLAKTSVRSAPYAETYEETDPGHRQNLLESLWSETLDGRFRSIQAAHTKTCEWLLTKAKYLEWLDFQLVNDHHGILWIKGKPGSGKSTFVKFLVATARKTMKDVTVVSFFFNARGEGLEKSIVGMYRSLIYQIMKDIPFTQRCLDQATATSKLGVSRDWDEDELQDIFESLVQSLGSKHLMCFVDALDECDVDDQIRDLVEFLERLGQTAVLSKTCFHVCLSSRHYPHISIEKSIQIILEDEEDHRNDITKYLDGKLRAGRGNKIDVIKKLIEEKSGGIFLWVVLVVPILNKAYDQGKIHALEKQLDEIPKKLDELFELILSRDQVDMKEFTLCLQWILYASRPLKREEIYYAMIAGNDPETLANISADEISVQDMSQYILHCSKGFAEVTKTKASTVQFIHESVREFFMKRIESEQFQFKLSPGTSHDALKVCCERYMAIDAIGDSLKRYYCPITDTSDGLPPPSALPKASTSEASKLRDTLQARFFFFDYAVRNILLHANAAEGFGVSQSAFLRHFDRHRWVIMDDILEKHEVRRHTKASMLYILAEKNLSGLVRLQMNLEPDPRIAVCQGTAGRYGSPLLAAIANATGSPDNMNTINALLRSRDGVTFDSSYVDDFDQLLRQAIEYNNLAIAKWLLDLNLVDPDRKDRKNQTPLHHAARKLRYTISQWLLSDERVQVDGKDKDGRTALSHACESSAKIGGEDVDLIVELLLSKDADPNVKDEERRTPLRRVFEASPNSSSVKFPDKVARMLLDKGSDTHIRGRYDNALQAASHRGSQEIVQILLDRGADVNALGGMYDNALQAAVKQGFQEIVQILLNRGADVNAQGGHYNSALQTASCQGFREIVQILLDRGADVNAQGGEYSSALQAASYSDSREIVQILLNRGADVNAQGGYHGSALQAASQQGCRKIVQILLDRGADVNAQGGFYGSALKAASYGGHREIVQILLDRGADVNAQGGHYNSALQTASTKGSRGIVQILLNRGADVNAQGGYYGSALQAASYSSFQEIVQILLDRGADVNAQGGYYGNTLQAAAAAWDNRREIVQMLLDRGADVNAQGGEYGSAMKAASYWGHQDVVKMLRERGAK